MRTSSSTRLSALAIRALTASAALAALIGLGTSSPASAQVGDRQLLSSGGGDPYVMILFDTSGSMAWGTACSADDRDEGLCEHDCPEPNCPLPRNGDDSNSKIYQAKRVLYEVMRDTGGVRWGFGSLNQDELAVGAKHWLYEVTAVSGVSDPAIPAIGWQEVFGAQTGGSGNTAFDMTCDRDGGGLSSDDQLYETGCYMTANDAPDTDVYVTLDPDELWFLRKLQRLPKGGALGTGTATFFMREPGGGSTDYYRFSYGAPSGRYCSQGNTGSSCTIDADCDTGAGFGDGVCTDGVLYENTESFTLTVSIDSCTTNNVQSDGLSCGAANNLWSHIGERQVTYDRTIARYNHDQAEEDAGGPITPDILDPGLGEFFWWEGSTHSDGDWAKDAYYGGRTDGLPVPNGVGSFASDIYADATCRGWEPSGDDWGQVDPVTVPGETDPHTGASTTYNLRWPTTHVTFDPPGTADDSLFEYGDFIPLDWNNDNLQAILTRLNPRHPSYDATDELTNQFSQAPFFADSVDSGENFLRLDDEDNTGTATVDEAIRPLIAHGSTPLAGWFSMFRQWYSGCGDPGNCDDTNTGWQDIAAQNDPNFACSAKYVLMITDGEESCDGSGTGGSDDWEAENYYEDTIAAFPDGFSKTADQCRYRASLSSQEDIETLVIGFGTENHAKLQCANTPVFFANNAGELKDLLIALIGEIQEQAAAFASAAVPTVQANILDKVYLSTFIPLNDEAVWPGRLDSFLKPLPLIPGTFLPDRDIECGNTLTAECFAWDAGDSQLAYDTDPGYDPQRLLLQAPIESEISDFAGGDFDNSTLQIGDGEDERRVYFGLPDSTELNRRQLFQFPEDPVTDPIELNNFEAAWSLPITDPVADAAAAAASREDVAAIVALTLQEKRAEISNKCTAGDPTKFGDDCASDGDCGESAAGAGDGVCTDAKVQYVMGDIFHSNPLVLNPPGEFEYFTKNLYWPADETDTDADTGLCGESAADTVLRGPEISYAWYSNKNLCRRVGLFVGSNDGQLHAFEAGIFRDAAADCKLWFAETASDATLSDVNIDTSNRTVGAYDFGTGREIFSFIPDSMMPLVEDLTTISGLTTEWGVDGTPLAADVFVDPYVAPGGSAECENRVWRTLLLSNYRTGGPGLFALDVTQPDTIDATKNVPEPVDATLDYVPSCSSGGAECNDFCRKQSGAEDAECAALAYPALRWEFQDLDSGGNPADDDGNGQADLSESWSRPFVARIKVCDQDCDVDGSGVVTEKGEDRFVAIFGGGAAEAPYNDATDEVGDWLYMVDVETGETVYKRGGTLALSSSPIVGSVPSDITGVDFDTDGYVDTLYFGTTAGYVYKVKLGNGPFDTDANGVIVDPTGLTGKYDPIQVFTTASGSDLRPIYLEIGAVYVPKLRATALLFGTGNRTDLWDQDGVEARFYALVDNNWLDTDLNGVRDGGVLDETSFAEVDPFDLVTPVEDYLYGTASSQPGWFFPLGANEKLITEPFTLAGVTFFTIFDPLLTELDDVCAFSGESKIFIVNTVTTKGYAVQSGSTTLERYFTAPTFTTQPYVEYSSTKNPGAANSGNTADDWTDELRMIYRELKRLFPSGAKFANFTLDIKTVRSDTGVVFIAPVPVAIEPHNWKEF